MIIKEYADMGLPDTGVVLPEAKGKQSGTNRIFTQFVDGIIIVAYMLSLISFMPLLLTYAWARDNWLTRDAS
ncbi:MAG: hypothetical protein AB4042_13175 [Leptolyngbyaceae cyanobacterium]